MLKEEVKGCPLPTRRDEGPPTEKMIHYCDQCDYKSYYISNVKRHRCRKYKTEYLLPFQNIQIIAKNEKINDRKINIFYLHIVIQ